MRQNNQLAVDSSILSTTAFYMFCLNGEELSNFKLDELIDTYNNNQSLRRFAPHFHEKLLLLNSKEVTPYLPEVQKNAFDIIALVTLQRGVIRELGVIAQSLNSQILLLKSSSLNGHNYSWQTPRGASDIDILISIKEKTEFELALSEVATRVQEAKARPFTDVHESSWLHNASGQTIDLHYHLINPLLFPIDTARLFEQSTPHKGYNLACIRRMTDSHNFLHACLHMFNDSNFFSHSAFDLIALLEHKSIITSSLKEAKIWNCEQVLMASLYVLALPTNLSENASWLTKMKLLLTKRLLVGSTKKYSFHRRLKQLLALHLCLPTQKHAFRIEKEYLRKLFFK